MAPVEATYAIIGVISGWRDGKTVSKSSNKVPQRMASESVATQQNHVDQQDQRAHADSEVAIKPKRFPHVVGKQNEENQREIKKIAMDILQNERKGAFAEIGLARFPHGAGWRVGPKSFVICAAVIVAGQTETAGRPQNQHCGRNPRRNPHWSEAEPGPHRIAKQFRRIERRKVRTEAVMVSLQGGPGGINNERGQTKENSKWLNPPIIAT